MNKHRPSSEQVCTTSRQCLAVSSLPTFQVSTIPVKYRCSSLGIPQSESSTPCWRTDGPSMFISEMVPSTMKRTDCRKLISNTNNEFKLGNDGTKCRCEVCESRRMFRHFFCLCHDRRELCSWCKLADALLSLLNGDRSSINVSQET